MADLQKFLELWNSNLTRDERMEQMVADDAVILSPAFWAPKQGKEYVSQVLGSVHGGTSDFTITH